MSGELNVIRRTQCIMIDKPSRSVAVINAGPSGPAGPVGEVTEVELAAALALKADLDYVDDELALKADLTYVDAELATKADILIGTGSPEGVVTAAVGTEYIDTAATCGAVKWMKLTGAGNTGWIVSIGDTGWRDITSGLLNAWTGTSVEVRRVPYAAYWKVSALVAPTPFNSTVIAAPAGFSPGGANTPEGRHLLHTTTPSVVRTNFSATHLTINNATGLTVYGSFAIPLYGGWPTSLP